jgi:hypothetical protein
MEQIEQKKGEISITVSNTGDQVRMETHAKESMKTPRMNNHEIEMHALRSLRAAHLVFLNHLSICKWIRHRLVTHFFKSC